MVACRFIVIKKPFLSKSQNTFPGERGTLPKAGNHSPVKFLDLSSDFSAASSPKGTRRPAHRNSLAPAPARPQSLPRPTAQHTGTHSSQLPPSPNPSRDPTARLHRNHPGLTSTRPRLPEGYPPPGSPELTRPSSRPAPVPPETQDPAPPEPSRLNFYPAPAPPKGNHRPAHRNLPVPAPARPQSLPRPAAQRCRNHLGSFSTRRQLTRRATRRPAHRNSLVPAPVRSETLLRPAAGTAGTIPAQFPPGPGSHRGTTARLTGTHLPQLPPGPSLSRDPRPSAAGTIPI